jgi:hypothetical protein
MRTVYKYELPTDPRFQIELPKGSSFLHVATQNGKPCMWIEVETNNALSPETFEIIGTGHEITEPELGWLGTWQDGPYVWHLYHQAWNTI